MRKPPAIRYAEEINNVRSGRMIIAYLGVSNLPAVAPSNNHKDYPVCYYKWTKQQTFSRFSTVRPFRGVHVRIRNHPGNEKSED